MLFFRKIIPPPKRKKYRIEDISTLWLNAETNGAGKDHSNIKMLPDPMEFTHQSTKIFWNQYVVRYYGQIRLVSGLKEAIITILKDLDQNGGCSSIDPDDHETHQKYHCLAEVNLRDHSFCVAKEMVDLLEKRKDCNLYVGKAILAGLSHDIGKSHKIMPSAGHSYNSAQWIKQMAPEAMKNIDIVIEAIRMHHRPNKTVLNKNLILHVLLEAGHRVRDDELRCMQGGSQMKTPDKDQRVIENRKEAASEPETIEKEHEPVWDWDNPNFPKKEFIKKLVSKITNFGFDAFRFEGHTYVSPKIMEEILKQLNDKRKEGGQISGSDFVKSRFKLKFLDRKIKPLTRYFIVFDDNALDYTEKFDQGPPRDAAGRWLKKIVKIEESKNEN
jgi:HD domain